MLFQLLCFVLVYTFNDKYRKVKIMEKQNIK